MSADKPNADDGPITAQIKSPMSARVLKRCHDQALLVDEATTILWRRELAQNRPIQREAGGRGRDWKQSALRLAAAMRKREPDELD